MSTREAFFKAREGMENRLDGLRNHLGPSTLGSACAYQVWLSLHWASMPGHTGQTLRRFDRGHGEESGVERILSRIPGVEVKMFDDDGGQFMATDPEYPIIRGSIDGVIKGLPDAVAAGLTDWIGLEIKTMSKGTFNSIAKKGIVSHDRYWTQVHMYMRLFGLPAFLHFSVCKDNDDVYTEIILSDESFTTGIREKQILMLEQLESPPPRYSSYESAWLCKMCDHVPVCHRGEKALVSCRSCEYSELKFEGEDTWHCNKKAITLDRNMQLEACEKYSSMDLANPY